MTVQKSLFSRQLGGFLQVIDSVCARLVQKDCMKVGYARVSTEEQNLDLQIEALTEAMELLDEGDLLVVWKLDRVGRSVADLIHLLKLFGDRGIESAA